MLDWIAKHHQIVAALTNVGMLVVWLTYLQLFAGGYRRQRRPKILINRGAGPGLGARCLVSNMSADPIYIERLLATLTTPEGELTSPVTELLDREERQVLPDRRVETRQGPLPTGDVVDMGTFHSLVDHVLERDGTPREALDTFIRRKLQGIEITVLAIHGSEDLPAGARRRFDIVRSDGDPRLRDCTIGTEQIRSRRERRRIARLLREDL